MVAQLLSRETISTFWKGFYHHWKRWSRGGTWNRRSVQCTAVIQGGSNMTGTNCDLFTHKSSRSYLNHLVPLTNNTSRCGRIRKTFSSDRISERWLAWNIDTKLPSCTVLWPTTAQYKYLHSSSVQLPFIWAVAFSFHLGLNIFGTIQISFHLRLNIQCAVFLF